MISNCRHFDVLVTSLSLPMTERIAVVSDCTPAAGWSTSTLDYREGEIPARLLIVHILPVTRTRHRAKMFVVFTAAEVVVSPCSPTDRHREDDSRVKPSADIPGVIRVLDRL